MLKYTPPEEHGAHLRIRARTGVQLKPEALGRVTIA